MHDKTFWQAIIDDKGTRPEGASLEALTEELLGYLRHSDPDLRDTYGYQLLAHWIIGGQYDNDRLSAFLARWRDDLTVGIGTVGNEQLLQRSFAALMLSILVYYDIKAPWMSDTQYHTLLTDIMAYFAAERDLRAYDAQVGWYHALAHTADTLKFLARHPKADGDIHQRILDQMATVLTRPQAHIYTHGEPDRMALVVLDIVKRDLIAVEAYQAWLASLVASKDAHQAAIKIDESTYGALQNVTAFLRALYVALTKNREELGEAAHVEYAVYEQMIAL